ncbi:hypothetical protein BaRGS_00007692 [Batillaria attramentaria]|uniref:Secreted protein n=1 Tax=Batillaria attramentaria TaxID=370345 RepID=A0ABD0LQ63_9CAEN
MPVISTRLPFRLVLCFVLKHVLPSSPDRFGIVGESDSLSLLPTKSKLCWLLLVRNRLFARSFTELWSCLVTKLPCAEIASRSWTYGGDWPLGQYEQRQCRLLSWKGPEGDGRGRKSRRRVN